MKYSFIAISLATVFSSTMASAADLTPTATPIAYPKAEQQVPVLQKVPTLTPMAFPKAQQQVPHRIETYVAADPHHMIGGNSPVGQKTPVLTPIAYPKAPQQTPSIQREPVAVPNAFPKVPQQTPVIQKTPIAIPDAQPALVPVRHPEKIVQKTPEPIRAPQLIPQAQPQAQQQTPVLQREPIAIPDAQPALVPVKHPEPLLTNQVPHKNKVVKPKAPELVPQAQPQAVQQVPHRQETYIAADGEHVIGGRSPAIVQEPPRIAQTPTATPKVPQETPVLQQTPNATPDLVPNVVPTTDQKEPVLRPDFVAQTAPTEQKTPNEVPFVRPEKIAQETPQPVNGGVHPDKPAEASHLDADQHREPDVARHPDRPATTGGEATHLDRPTTTGEAVHPDAPVNRGSGMRSADGDEQQLAGQPVEEVTLSAAPVQRQAPSAGEKALDHTRVLGSHVAANSEAIGMVNAKADKNAADILDLRSDLEEQGKRINGIGAMAMATSNLVMPYNVGKFSATAGVGSFDGESAIAVGTGYRFNENVTVRASAAYETGSENVGVGAGVGFEW